VGKVKMMEIDRFNITYSKIRHSPHSHKHFLSEFSCTYILYTAKSLYRKLETNIPRNETAAK
jgi:hypothetical protein